MVTVEIALKARQMLAEADDRWIAEHGFVDNPLWEEVNVRPGACAKPPRSVRSTVAGSAEK